MGNFLSMLSVDVQIFKPVSWCAAISSVFYGLFTIICKVLGLFADLMNIAFYIFSGIDFKENVSDASGRYDIKVISTGEKQNILDYFVFSSSMRQAYLYLAVIGLVLIVIFTIYKIIKQDFFDKAGPRSKGPIFRNVAFSCISFLLVIPIFWIIIHASSLLAVAVATALGMDFNQLAGAKIFCLSWSDNGAFITTVNNYLRGTQTNTKIGWMWNLDGDSLFVTMAKGKYVQFETRLIDLGTEERTFKSFIPNDDRNFAEAVQHDFQLYDGTYLKTGTPVYFYWYIYLVGVVVGIKTLYKLLLAMLQRIFKLMGLFLVAPSPISQYVLDDGQKYKSWLAQSIQEGLRLVVATMSFAIFLLVLEAVTNIDFISAFNTAVNDASSESNTINVSAKLLSYSGEVERVPMLAGAEGDSGVLGSLANSFLKIFVLMGAGGAVTDLDPVLTPLISGGKSSLDAGATGSAASAPVNVAKSAAGALVGSVVGGISSGVTNAVGKARKAGKAEGEAAADKDAAKIEKGINKENTPKPTGGGTGGTGGTGGPGGTGGSGGDTKDGASAPSQGAPTEENKDKDGGVDGNAPENDNNDSNEGAGDGEVETPENEDGADNNAQSPEGEENKDGEEGTENSETEENKDGAANTENEENKDNTENGAKPATASAKTADSKKADKPNFAHRKFGKVLRRMGMGALEIGRSVGRGTLGGLRGVWKGLGKAISTSAKMIAVGALGKDTVEAFAGAKKEYAAKEKERTTKAHDKAYEKGYTKRVQNQMDNAAANATKKGEQVDKASGELMSAAAAEQTAATQLSEAETAQAAEGVKAAQANQAAVDGDSVVADNEGHINAYNEKIATVTSENEEILAKHGGNEAKFKEAYHTAVNAGDNITKEQEEIIKDYTKYDRNTTDISRWAGSRDSLEESNKYRAGMINTLSDSNGDLTKAGVTAGMSFEEAKKKVSESDAASPELKAAFNNSDAKEVYNDTSTVVAREANDRSRVAAKNVETAQKAYKVAHTNTQTKQVALEQSVEQYNNAVKLAERLGAKADQTAEFKFGTSTTADGLGQRWFRGARRQQRENTLYDINRQRENVVGTVTAATSTASKVKPPKDVTAASMNEYLDRQAQEAEVQRSAGMAAFNQYAAKYGETELEFAPQQVDIGGGLDQATYSALMDGVMVKGTNGQNSSINLARLNTNFQAMPETTEAERATKAKVEGLIRQYNGTSSAAKFNSFVNKGTHGNESVNYRGISKEDGRSKTGGSVVSNMLDIERYETPSDGEGQRKRIDELDKTGKREQYETLKSGYVDGFEEHMKKGLTTPVKEKPQPRKMKVEDFMNQHIAEDGNYNQYTIASDLEGAADGEAKAGMAAAIGSYNSAKETYNSRMTQINTARHIVDTYSQNGNNIINRAGANLDKYVDTVAQVETLNSVIDNGGKGPISRETRRLIGGAIGSADGMISTKDPQEIVKLATQAREVKYAEQQQLIKSSEGLAREGTKNNEDLRSAMASMIDMLSGKLNGKGNNVGQDTTNVTNINNYTQGNNTANEWFNNSNTLNNTNNQGIPAASGLAQSDDRTAMYERMQVEGINHMQNIVDRLRDEFRDTSRKIDDIKDTVDDLADK